MSKFVVGKTYSTRSICDYDCVISVTIVKRTAKTVTLAKAPKGNGQRVFSCKEFDGVEQLSPWGRYSMSPVIRAA